MLSVMPARQHDYRGVNEKKDSGEQKCSACSIDAICTARFTIPSSYTGYARLEMGRTSKLLYVEDGGHLRITYDSSADKRYVFEGEGSAENDWLDSHERLTVRLSKDLPLDAHLPRPSDPALEALLKKLTGNPSN